MSKTLDEKLKKEVMESGPILSDEESIDELSSQSLSQTMETDEHKTEIGADTLSDPVVVAQPQYVRQGFLLSLNQSYVTAATERCAVLHAEEAAGDAQLKQFKPANRGLKGYVKRKKDESELERITKETGVVGLDLYTMRINKKLLTEKEKDSDRQPEEFSQKVEKALTWNLSWQMLSPRYLYYNAEKIYDISRTYKELRAEEGANDAFLKTLPEKKAASYEAIMNMTGIFLMAFEQKMTLGGVNMATGEYETPAEDYEVHNLNDLKERFEAERRKLMQTEEPVVTEEKERQTRNEQLMPKAQKILSERQSKYSSFMDSFHKELRKNQDKDKVTAANDRVLTGLLESINGFSKLSMKNAVKIYKGLSIAGFVTLNKVPIEKLVEFREAAEVVINHLLNIDMSQFRFDGDEDLTADDIQKKLAILNFGMELEPILKSYDILQKEPVYKGFDPGCTFSTDLIKEAHARAYTLEYISGVYRGRLKLLASPSYGEYSEEELEAMSVEEANAKAAKAASRADEERVAMYINLIMMKSSPDFIAGSDPMALLQKKRADYGVTPNIDEWLETERNMRSISEEKLKRKIGSKIDAMFVEGTTDQEKILKTADLFLVISHTGDMSFMRNKRPIRNIFEKGNDWLMEEGHISVEFIQKEEEVRQGLLDELYAKYEQLATVPVPAEYLKEGVEANDPEAMQQFAAIKLRSDETALRIAAIQTMISPLLREGQDIKMPDGKICSLKMVMQSLDFQHQQAIGDDATRVLSSILTDHGNFDKLNEKAIGDSKVWETDKIQSIAERFMVNIMRDQ